MLLHDSPACPSVIFQRKEKWLHQADKLHTAVPLEGFVESPAFNGTRRLRACSWSLSRATFCNPSSAHAHTHTNTHAHTHTHHTYTLGFLLMSDVPVTETATYTTKNQHKGRTSTPQAGFKLPNPSYQASAYLRLRLRTHRDQQNLRSY